MNHYAEIALHVPALRSEWERIARALLGLGFTPPDISGATSVSLQVPSGAPTIPQIERILRDAGVHRWTRRRVVFSPADRAAAAWLHLSLSRPGRGEPQAHTEFDASAACPRCGVGRRPIDGISIERKALPVRENLAAAVTGEILIGAKLAKEVERQVGPTGDLVPVHDASTRRPLDWLCVWPRNSLPPMDARSLGVERVGQCTRCGRDGLYWSGTSDLVLVYPRPAPAAPGSPAVETRGDFAATWEHFGHSAEDPSDRARRGFRTAVPLVLVSQRIGRIIEEHGRGRWALTPVIWADDAGLAAGSGPGSP